MSYMDPTVRMTEDSPELADGDRGFTMTYRHWFVISLLILMNVVIFGCLLLAALDRIRVGF